MSILRKVELGDDILVTLKMTKKEYDAIGPDVHDLLVFPANGFNRILTTGTLGNGNRIMVPGKYLKNNNIHSLKKNVRSSIANLGDRKFLIIELVRKGSGVPVFGEGYDKD